MKAFLKGVYESLELISLLLVWWTLLGLKVFGIINVSWIILGVLPLTAMLIYFCIMVCFGIILMIIATIKTKGGKK